MIYFTIAVLVAGFTAILWCILALIRNNLTYKIRIRAIEENWEAYNAGPGYKEMMWDLRHWTYKGFYK
jgi:hypothetical protein